MKINSIEIENFRNFKGFNKIVFDTEKAVNIIYGKNGDGKTTLHQLFQWVFYNEVHFNKTASNKMYNLEYEAEAEYDQIFCVKGSIEFIHSNEKYSLNRIWTYQRGLSSSTKIKEELSLYKLVNDNYNKLLDPEAVIEELLPSGLSEYFFFDGESMIADLSVKGKESANKLKNALYTIFDLSIYEQALIHIGNKELKTTALGQLYLNKADANSDEGIKVIKTNISNAQEKINQLEEKEKSINNEENKKKEYIQEISEIIGKTKSSEEYEKDRKRIKGQQVVFIENEKRAYKAFGEEVIKTFPRMMVSKRIEEAKKVLKLKADQNTLIPGINKPLIESLSKETNCICGREINDEERKHIVSYLNLLPPLSYQQTYDNFTNEAKRWSGKYERDSVEQYIIDALNNRKQAAICDKEIQKIDDEAKRNLDVQDLIIKRKTAENEITEIVSNKNKIAEELFKFRLYRKQQMNKFDELTRKTDLNKEINYKMNIMEQVKEHFEDKLHNKSIKYSEKLQEEIQYLLNVMLTSKRKVTVSKDFFVRVIDKFNDEAKSGGQFAVVSFAYIGGIMKLLSDELQLNSKEYPLVIDGPFSKLDKDQKKNVIETIPKYAPQIILFSKDNLQGMFDSSVLGSIWTIQSNEEKNVAEVKEGYLW